jgi:hypothetical protein
MSTAFIHNVMLKQGNSFTFKFYSHIGYAHNHVTVRSRSVHGQLKVRRYILCLYLNASARISGEARVIPQKIFDPQ